MTESLFDVIDGRRIDELIGMAAITIGRDVDEPVILMAIQTNDRLMCAGEWKRGLVMVESRSPRRA